MQQDIVRTLRDFNDQIAWTRRRRIEDEFRELANRTRKERETATHTLLAATLAGLCSGEETEASPGEPPAGKRPRLK